MKFENIDIGGTILLKDLKNNQFKIINDYKFSISKELKL